jgi:acetylornithine deacetylase/succinyl-diaminopimelate desuccinylase-like protein
MRNDVIRARTKDTPDAAALVARREVSAALALLADRDADTIADQCALAAIPAPSGEEAERARFVTDRLVEAGQSAVEQDEVGNVVAWHACADPTLPPILLAAHLDTVFPATVEHRVRREGARLIAPGIVDNARGLAGMLALARALAAVRIRTVQPLVLIATVGEEGAGDLRGVKHLFAEGQPWRGAAAFLALDGGGRHRIVHRAVGSRRLRVEVSGPGGHSWADRGTANPLHAVGHAIAALLGDAPATNGAITVARSGGGESVNAVPARAWMELDLRSESADELADMERRVRARVGRAVRRESAARRAGTQPLVLSVDVFGDRPCGTTRTDAFLVRAAEDATRQLGLVPELIASSTDANVPMALGIPAIALGAGGESGGTHTTGEWYANEGGPEGLQRALLVVLAVAGIAR